MKIFKLIPTGYLVATLAFISVGATYSARSMIEIGEVATITGSLPEIEINDTDPDGVDWEIEFSHNLSEDIGLEIAPLNSPDGTGPFKIKDDSNEDALTVNDRGITVNGEEGSTELTVFGQGIGDEQVTLTFHPDANKETTAQVGIDAGSDNFIIRTSGANGGGFNSLFWADLDAPEDSLTILESGQARFGIPIGNSDASFTTDIQVPSGIHIGGAAEGEEGWELRSRSLSDDFVIKDVDGDTESLFVANDRSTTLSIGSLSVIGRNVVGIGTKFADSTLHVNGNDGFTRLTVEENNSNVEIRTLSRLTNNGPSKIEMTNTDTGRTWSMVADFNDTFQIRQNGPNTANFAIRQDGTFSFNNLGESVMALRPNGDLRISGVLTEGSDRNIKENIAPVDPADVLKKVVDLPISTWNYINDQADSQHLGPMAQDFFAAFELGDDDKKIATLDTSGVALAAIQGLNKKLEESINVKKADFQFLVEENQNLRERIQQIERMVETLTTK